MEATESLVIAIKALQDIKTPIVRSVFIDFLLGKENEDVEDKNLGEKETYGSGKEQSEAHWSAVLEAAVEEEYIRIKSAKKDTIEYTSKGKTFARKPSSFVIEDSQSESNAARPSLKLTPETASPKTKLQIKLIQAIDRKMALDDFAETESVGLAEVLDELELLQQQGRQLEITYFTDEVIGKDDMQELMDYFEEEGDDLDKAMEEYGDVYHAEEIRLARLVWRAE